MNAPLRRFDLEDLTAGQCRWPEGDGPFRFCGQPVTARPSSILTACYCPHHGLLAVAAPLGATAASRRTQERESA